MKSFRTIAVALLVILAIPLHAQSTGGNGTVQGAAANGANVAGNPVLTGGSDGTKARTFKTDATGQIYIANPGSGGGVVTQSDHTLLLGTSYQGGTWLDQIMGVNGTSIATAINPFPVSIQGAIPAGTNVIGHVINDASSAVIGHVIADSGSTTAVTGNVTAVQATGSNLHVQVDTAPTTTVTGTVTANAGTGTFAVSAASLPLPTSAATDASVTGLQVSQGSTTSGQKGGLALGAVTTAAPSYTTAQSSPLSLDTTGNLRTSVNNTVTVGTHAVTQSGTWTNQLSDGTTTANVGPASGAQTGNTYLQVGGTYQSQAFSVSAAGNGTTYDAGGYASVKVQILTVYTGSTSVTFQCSNDGTTWVATVLTSSAASTTPFSAINAATLAHGPLSGRYFRLVYAGTQSSGSTTGTIVFSTLPDSPTISSVTAAQSGTWTVQPGNTANTTPWLTTNTASAAGGYSFSHISTNATTTAKSGAGTLHSITINTPGATDTLTVYDNAAGSGTVIAVINDASTSAVTLTYDVAFATGLTVVSAGTTAPDVTVAYK